MGERTEPDFSFRMGRAWASSCQLASSIIHDDDACDESTQAPGATFRDFGAPTQRRHIHASPKCGVVTHALKKTSSIDLKTVQAPVLAMADRFTDEWLIHADTHALPDEDLPLRLSGRTGADYGWPNRMMGASTFQMLADRQITRTSQLIQLAECMTEAQFQAYFEGNRPCWAYLRRAGEDRPGSQNRRDYEDRLIRWQADQWNVNNRILGEWLLRREPPLGPPHPPPVPALPGIPIYPPFGQSELLDAAARDRVWASVMGNWTRQGSAGTLPQEDLPVHLLPGETGAHYDWPHLMMDTDTLQRLARLQITRTSQLIQLASCMTKAQFRAYVGGNQPNWAYLISLVDLRPENIAEYERRKRRWLGDHCIVNSRILDGWLRGRGFEGDPPLGDRDRLDPRHTVPRGGRDLNQLQLVEDTIAENNRRNAALD
jgi:hypothetical protein